MILQNSGLRLRSLRFFYMPIFLKLSLTIISAHNDYGTFHERLSVMANKLWLGLLDGWIPSPASFLVGIGEACPTISATFQNWQYNIHSHFTQWLVSCAKLRKEAGFELLSLAFSCILYTTTYITFHMYNRVQHYEYLPGKTVWKCMMLSPLSVYEGRLFCGRHVQTACCTKKFWAER